MNVEAVRAAISKFLRRHRATLSEVAHRQSQLLELGATVGVVQHYKAAGYGTIVLNPNKDGSFRVKLGTRGHPCDYSRVICTKGNESCEIHSNVSARGAHDDGIYCVDVAVVKPGAIPSRKPKGSWRAISNEDLITFVEVKRLVVYPMLLAQFLGIVHEIRPEFLFQPLREGFGGDGNLAPALVALGHLSGNSTTILDGFRTRGFTLLVADRFDARLSRCRNDLTRSPFYYKPVDDEYAF
jgi:hypothetical protein